MLPLLLVPFDGLVQPPDSTACCCCWPNEDSADADSSAKSIVQLFFFVIKSKPGTHLLGPVAIQARHLVLPVLQRRILAEAGFSFLAGHCVENDEPVGLLTAMKIKTRMSPGRRE